MGARALRDHEHRQPLVAGDQRVRVALGRVQQHVVLADRVGAHVLGARRLPADPGALEHEEHLVLVDVGVRGRAARAGRDLDDRDAHAQRVRGRAEPLAARVQLADLPALLGDVVDVDRDAVAHGGQPVTALASAPMGVTDFDTKVAAVLATDDLDLVGVALRAPHRPADQILRGLERHP